MSKKVFKTLVASSLLVFSAFSVSSCIVMVPYGTQGQEGDVVESDITAINITNKEDLVAEWHAGEASRKIEATLEGVEMGLLNATIQGYVVIESSAPEIVEVSGLNLIAKAEGNAIITLRASKCSTFIALKIEPAINNTMKLADIKSKIVAGELKDKDVVEFNGYITALINKNEDQLYNGVWVQDGDAAIQLYAGNITEVFKATPDLFTIGNKVHVKGALSPYNGLNEVKPTEISLVEDDTLIVPATLALTGDNFSADDLAGKDGQLVSAAKLIYAGADHPVVSDTVAAKKHTTLNFKLEKSDKSLVDCDVYINYHIGDEALGALKAIAANLVSGDIVSVEGLLSWYNKPQITFGELANGKKPGDCMVITGEKYTFADPESITITSKDDATKVLVGKTLQLTASVLPANAVQTVTWSSSNPEVATVSEKGVVKGIKAGEVTITATSTAKADVKQEFILSVEEEVKPEHGPQLVTGAPVVGTEYILGLVHDTNAETYYATGAMEGYYYGTSTDYTAAGKVGFVAVDGGFSMTMTTADGTKYMNIIKSGTHINVVYEDAASSVWTYDATNNAMVTDLEGTTYFLGTNNTKTYKTLSACTSFDGSYVARLYTPGEAVPAITEPQLVVGAPEVGKEYIIGLVHETNQETYYATGVMDGYYYATSTDYTAAGKVGFVAVDGGFSMTMTTAAGTKYMNIIKSGTHINVVYEDAASSVWAYNADYNAMTTVLEETTYFLGTNNTKTYKTLSACTNFDGSYVARLYTPGEATPVDPEPVEPTAEPQLVEAAPSVQTDYIIGLVHETNAETYYLTGAMDGYYYGTTTDYTAAGTVRVVEVEGGFHMTMTTAAGTKYMNIVKSGTHINVVYEDAASSVWAYDADHNAMTTVLEETTYFLGTNNTKTYKTLSACTNFDGSYVARFYTPGEATPVDPEPVEPTAEPQLVETAPSVQTDYIIGLVHETNAETYYLTGAMDGYYYGTSTDYTAAGTVRVVEVEGGFHMTMTTAAGTKYMNIVKSGTHINVVYEDAASSVWAYDADHNAMTTVLEETTYFLGTNNTKTYKTLSACTNFDGSYVARFYKLGEATPVEPGGPVDPEPAEGDVQTVEILPANYTAFDQRNSFNLNTDDLTVAASDGIIKTNEFRFYKNSTLSFEGATIKEIKFECSASGTAEKGPGNFTVDVGTYAFEEKVGTWSGEATKVVFTASTAKVFATKITVKYVLAA